MSVAAENMLATLDRQIAKKGQDITLRRYTGTGSNPLGTWTEVTLRGRMVPANTAELVAGINITGRRMVLSPTGLSGPAVVTQRDAIMDGVARRVIQVWSPIVMDGIVVRIEVQLG